MSVTSGSYSEIRLRWYPNDEESQGVHVAEDKIERLEPCEEAGPGKVKRQWVLPRIVEEDVLEAFATTCTPAPPAKSDLSCTGTRLS